MIRDPIFIVGRPRSGKSIFAAHVARALGVPLCETSTIIAESLGRVLAANPFGKKCPAQACAVVVLKHKARFRPMLIAHADELCRAFSAALGMLCVQQGAMVVAGVRREAEARALYAAFPQSRWVRIERYGCPQDNYEEAFFEEFCQHTVDNNGTPDELAVAALTFAGRVMEEERRCQ